MEGSSGRRFVGVWACSSCVVATLWRVCLAKVEPPSKGACVWLSAGKQAVGVACLWHVDGFVFWGMACLQGFLQTGWHHCRIVRLE